MPPPAQPLIPLDVFRDRNFSLCNAGVAIVSFADTATMLSLTYRAQAVCDYCGRGRPC